MDKYWPEEKIFLAVQHALGRKTPPKGLLGYLKKFRYDELTSGTTNRPASFLAQRKNLVNAMRKKFPEQGFRQLIRGSKMDVDVQNFWELIFVMHYITHEVEVVSNIGFDRHRVASGLSTSRKIPHAEFKIVGKDLKEIVAGSVGHGLPVTTPAQSTHRVVLAMTKSGSIYAELVHGERRLIKKLRTDSAAYNFMNYMLGHQNSDVPRGDINTKVEGCKTKKDMTELAKDCGFSKDLHPLKSTFFGGTTKEKAYLKASAELDSTQLELLLAREEIIV